MPDFGAAERRILSYFVEGQKLLYKGDEYTIIEADKPTCPIGEPKTDIYVLVQNQYRIEEIKISYKKKNAHFLENKTSAERAEKLLGANWRGIIEHTTSSIRDRFENRMRIYKNGFGKTRKGSMTLGWKFELMLVPGGDLSGTMDFTYDQIVDVYSGINLPPMKRNAIVNGRVIKDSGIADFILHTDYVGSAQDVINQMVTVEEFIERHPNIYFACKALNYRTFDDKYDGNRPLAVQVDWKVSNGKLVSDIVYEHPLEMNGTEMAERLFYCLDRLSIETTDDIDDDNADMSHVYE